MSLTTYAITTYNNKIIINFYGAYILTNLNSEAQQNRIIKHNREQGHAKVSIRTRDNRTFMVKKTLAALKQSDSIQRGKNTYVQTSIHNYMYIVLARVFTMIYTKVGE